MDLIERIEYYFHHIQDHKEDLMFMMQIHYKLLFFSQPNGKSIYHLLVCSAEFAKFLSANTQNLGDEPIQFYDFAVINSMKFTHLYVFS